MKKRLCCITIALCTVFCILFTAGCGKAAKTNTALPEVRNNGTAIDVYKRQGAERLPTLIKLRMPDKRVRESDYVR